MSKKPYIVHLEMEIAVFLNNEDEAYSYNSKIQEAVRDQLHNLDDYVTFVDDFNRIPDGWTEECLVYGADGEVTVKEALKWEVKEEVIEDKHTAFLPFDERSVKN